MISKELTKFFARFFIKFVSFSVIYFIFLNLYQFIVYHYNNIRHNRGGDHKISDFSLNFVDEERAIVRENMPTAMVSYVLGGVIYVSALVILMIRDEKIIETPLARFLGTCSARSGVNILILYMTKSFHNSKNLWHIKETNFLEDKDKTSHRVESASPIAGKSTRIHNLIEENNYNREKINEREDSKIKEEILEVETSYHRVGYFALPVMMTVSCFTNEFLIKNISDRVTR